MFGSARHVRVLVPRCRIASQARSNRKMLSIKSQQLTGSRFFSNTTTKAKPMLSLPVKALLVVGGAGVLGTAGVMHYLKLDFSDLEDNVKEYLGMAEPIPMPVAADLIDLPELPAPDEYVHPYHSRSMLWQWTFTIKRIFYLAWLLIPVARATACLAYDSKNEIYLKHWCDTLVNYINTAGCSFQKFGQWISMRPDMFPPALIEATSQLRDSVPAHTYAETVYQIETTLGRKVEEIFVSINEQPVASGSVGQVHEAVVKPEFALSDGTTHVAIKVRHPAVLDETFVDLAIVFGIVPIMNTALAAWPGSKTRIAMPFSPEALFVTIQKQLDFKWEAFNLIEFQRNFYREMRMVDKFGIQFPCVSVDLLSDSVLIESWAPGKTIADMFANLNNASEEVRGQLADTVFDITAKMFLRDNFIHGDMHAGNLLFHRETGVVTVMDAGLVTALPWEMFNAFGDFIRALCTKDVAEVTDKLILFHDETALNAVRQTEINKLELLDDIRDIFETGGGSNKPGRPAAQALGDILGDMLRRIGKHDVLLRSDIASCIMTISIAEGLIMLLDPNMDILEKSIPYFIKYRGWESAQEIVQTGYVTSERKAKNIKEELENFVESGVESITGSEQQHLTTNNKQQQQEEATK